MVLVFSRLQAYAGPPGRRNYKICSQMEHNDAINPSMPGPGMNMNTQNLRYSATTHLLILYTQDKIHEYFLGVQAFSGDSRGLYLLFQVQNRLKIKRL